MNADEATPSVTDLVAENEVLRTQIAALERELRWMKEQLETTLQRLYGRKSERWDPNQPQLFPELAAVPEPTPPAPEVVRKERPRRGHGRRQFPEHLPRDTVRCTLPEEDQVCPECEGRLKEIGADVCERGHIVRPKLVVRRFEKVKYACPAGHAVKVAQAPPALIDRCKYEPSVYAHITVAKYGDHTPLHRLEGILERHGFQLPKSTMWDMLVRVDEIAAQPILEQMRQELLRERILLADETVLPVLLEGEKKAKNGYLWSWQRGRRILYRFTLSRSRDGPIRFLGDWKGTLLTDGYSGYAEVARRNGIQRAGCWAHVRRKFKEAWEVGATEVAPILALLQRLFGIEAALKARVEQRSLTDEEAVRLVDRVRRQRSRRVVDSLFAAARELASRRGTTPKSKVGKALAYLENQREPLRQFLNDPELPIHNNSSERSLRHVVLGRKNFLFTASERGAEVAANLYSLVYSCKAAGVNPEAYLEDVLSAVSTTPSSRIAELTPWAWAERHPDAILEQAFVAS